MNATRTVRQRIPALCLFSLLGAGLLSSPAQAGLVTDSITTTNASATNYILGAVGIGTTNPTYTLDITGNLRVTGTGTFAAVTGNGSGLTGIGSNALAAGSVGSAQIAAGAINSAQLAVNAVQATNIANSAITSAKIASGAVGSAQLAASAVGSANIAANAVGSSQLAANAVIAGKIATNAVLSYNIATGAVGSAQLASNLTISGSLTISNALTVLGPITGINAAQVGAVPTNNARYLNAWQNPATASNWTWTSDGTQITLTGYTGPNNVVVPTVLDGLPVTTLGYLLFCPNATNGLPITSVTAPSITNICCSVFYNCTSLTKVIIPAATVVNTVSLFGCSSLQSVYIGQNAPSEATSVFGGATTNVTTYVTNPQTTGWGSAWNGKPVVRLPLYGDGSNLTNITAAQVGAVATNNSRYLTALTNAAAFDAAGAAAAVQAQLPAIANAATNAQTVANTAQTTATNALQTANAKLSPTGSGAALTGITAAQVGAASSTQTIRVNGSTGNLSTNNQFYIPANPTDLSNWSWATNGDNTITITGYNQASINPTIPAFINGLPVANIGANAFAYWAGITNITFPSSITNIGATAFGVDTSLQNVTLPANLISLPYNTFAYCTSLTSLTIPASVTMIGDYLVNGIALSNLCFAGNAPTMTTNALAGLSTKVSFIYGKTGFPVPPATFGGQPTAYWAPQLYGGGQYLTGITAAQVGAVATNDARYLAAQTNIPTLQQVTSVGNSTSRKIGINVSSPVNQLDIAGAVNIGYNAGNYVIPGNSLMVSSELLVGNFYPGWWNGFTQPRLICLDGSLSMADISLGNTPTNSPTAINWSAGWWGPSPIFNESLNQYNVGHGSIDLVLSAVNKTNISLNQNGFVGINGVMTPVYPIDVNGDINSSGNVRGNGQYLTGITAAQVGALPNTSAGIAAAAIITNNNAGVATLNSNLVVGGEADFSSGNGLAWPTDYSYIKTPNHILFIAGYSGLTFYTADPGAPTIFVNNYKGEQLRILPNGYSGFGTTNPTERLHVIGNGIISSNLTVNGTINGNGSQLAGITAAQVGAVSTGATITINGNTGRLTSNLTFTVSGGNVASVFGRTGAIVATAGDYNAAQVGAVATNGSANGLSGCPSGADPINAATTAAAAALTTATNAISQAFLNVGPYGDVSMGGYTTRGQ